MSYQAIARKWRPTTFEEIAGQRHVTRTLRNAIELSRIHHAFLFTGPRGVGKTTAARALARALQCANGPTPEPCGTCPLCTAILAGSCPDVIEIDGASNNSVDDVRDLRDGVRYLPQLGRYRIYIIDEVHMLTRGAFNALLKTLEEPPPHVIFMFATTEAQKIPETILSRVQRFDFKRIPVQVVADRLRTICDAEGIQISEASLRLVARAGEGSMRDAQSLLDQVVSFCGTTVPDGQVVDLLGLVDRSILYQMLEGLIRGDAARCLDAIAVVHDHGFEMGQFTEEMLEVLRNAAIATLSAEAHRHLDVPADEIAQLQELTRGLGPEVFARWFDVLLEVHDQVSRASQPRLVLEMAVARLATIRPSPGLPQLVARLEDLERRLRQGGAPPPSRPGPSGPGGAGPRPSAPGPGGFGSRPAEPGRAPPGPRPSPDPAPRGDDAPRGVPPARLEPPTRPAPPAAAPPPPGPTGGPVPAFRPPPPPSPRPAPAVPPRPAPDPLPDNVVPLPLFEAPPPPEPEEDEEVVDEPPSPLDLPTVHPEDPPAVRYQRVLDVLPERDLGWVQVRLHSVLESYVDGHLLVAFSSRFHMEQCRGRLASAELRPVLLRAFPDLRKVEAVERKGHPEGQDTRHEIRETARSAYAADLRIRVEAHPAVQALQQRLGAEIEDIQIPKTMEFPA